MCTIDNGYLTMKPRKINKCQFARTCKYFNENNKTCVYTAGRYYSNNRFAGCHRNNQEIKELTDVLKTLRIKQIKDGISYKGSISCMEQRLKDLRDE